MTALLQRFTNIRRDEVASVLAAAFFFFCVLTALMLLRPAREALGVSSGLDTVRWLFIGTAVVTLAVNPVFATLVSRFRRLVFITTTYLFFAASLVVFYGLLTFAPEAVGEISGRVFYVWFSVFNFFSTMVFWALMADRFSLEQSKRLFGVIAVGGTLGAIVGPGLARLLARPLGTPSLLLIAAGFLGLGCLAALLVARLQAAAGHGATQNQAVIGGSAWDGLRSAVRSPYLLGISGYVLILAVIATFLYFTRLNLVAAMADDVDTRTAIFANIDIAVQVTTLVLQLVVTGHLMKRLGVSVALAILPVIVLLGFVGLTIAGSLVVFTMFQATFSAAQRAFMRPARETLFTILSREDKYKAKAFIDTFVYRGGDVVGAWTEGLLATLGMGVLALAAVVAPLAGVWAILGVWLGRAQSNPEQHGTAAASEIPMVTAKV